MLGICLGSTFQIPSLPCAEWDDHRKRLPYQYNRVTCLSHSRYCYDCAIPGSAWAAAGTTKSLQQLSSALSLYTPHISQHFAFFRPSRILDNRRNKNPNMMAGFMSYFGGRRDPKQSSRDAIVTLRQQLQMIEKKEDYLQKKVDEEVKKAKANAVSNKAGAFINHFTLYLPPPRAKTN